MSIENYMLLVGLISAHPENKIVGRTRVQKEVKLLQRLGFPTDYSYTIHFYGPYSESLQADIGLLEAFDLVDETCEVSNDGNSYYILRAASTANTPKVQKNVGKFSEEIALLSKAPTVVLELAATYDAFREVGGDHEEAIRRLRIKKRDKCTPSNERDALQLLESLNLVAD